ncbi:tyrosine-protein phosphatase [Macrococcus armenti]|uniref:tyrosine-protein phosphatase n=1 Tax=Macrococcus armenti TaxID=2875764 RepID=UPI001CCED48C|nr:CpsB/CapC family capsule biosynthesis tyrosine phosphatase [Macrococcus armenti]UBH12758.1 tyrosine protein phosphatase [Macrococcus armenti]UBH22000.1 tyrosine protein phosphatase [Macrococcus armenti]
MIDIHNHILYGVDDGAQCENDTLDMARQAVSEGITDIIATPHHKIQVYENFGPKVIDLTEKVNQLLTEHNIPLKVHASQEIRIYGDVITDLKSGKALPLAGQYVLIEFPSNEVPIYTEQLFTQLAMEGYVPIIAHPERNTELQKNPKKLAELIELGALAQVTAGVVVGNLGHRAQSVAELMIEHQLIHFVASDAHNINNRNFHMKAAYETIESKFGVDVVSRFQENAQKVLNGEQIPYLSPKEIVKSDRTSERKEKKKKKKFLGLF